MDRARRLAVPLVTLILVTLAIAAPPASRPQGGSPMPAANVGWLPSDGLLVGEVVTGGASASDEYVEVVNAGSTPIDIAGLELIYVTASGSTVTRKASWASPMLLDPGRRVLAANGSGLFASSADLTYSGGFAATGGAVALRVIGGEVIDSIGWGDATSGFVEGPAAPPPPAGSSIERLPGGSAGNSVDTNDNAADVVINSNPEPRNSSAGPLPEPSPTAEPSPPPSPEPSPSPSPGPEVMAIAEARMLANGEPVAIEGIVTVGIGALESGRAGFVQDATAGISVYLSEVAAGVIPAGSRVRVGGTVDDRYGQRTVRVALGDVAVGGAAELPPPTMIATGSAGESIEGMRVAVAGEITTSPDQLADGVGIDIDDGSGPLRVVVGPDALAGASVGIGDAVEVTGPLGQRDSSGTGLAGYRIHAVAPGDLVVLPDPSPSPEASPSPSPEPAASPSPSPSAVPSPSPSPSPSPPAPSPEPSVSPTPTPALDSIAVARRVAVGDRVHVMGVVTAERGRVGHPETIAIGDGMDGILVRLPDSTPTLPRGTIVEATGTIAEPFGQREIRPTGAGEVIDLGPGSIVVPLRVVARDIGESVEGRLASIDGTVTQSATRSTSGDIAFEITDETGTVRIMADASAGVERASIRRESSVRIVGIVGQRATRKGRLDGYRIWLRDPADLSILAVPPTPTPSSGHPEASPHVPPPVSIARAILAGGEATVEAVVIAHATLLDAGGRRIVVSDATAGIEVLVPSGTTPPTVNARVRASGVVGRAYGAPRLRATTIEVIGRGIVRPIDLERSPGPAHEWRLVRVTGSVADLKKLGKRWRAELRMSGGDVAVVDGLAGAGIDPALVAEGRRLSITGIVRRPYPTARDRRYAVAPRSVDDLVLLGAVNRGAATPGGPASGAGLGSVGVGGSAAPIPDADLALLAEHIGDRVRVGGLVVEVRPDGILLDDGTATGSVVLEGEAAEYLPLLAPADAINVTGRVRQRADDDFEVVATAGADIARVGDLLLGGASSAPLDSSVPGEPRGSAPAAPRQGLLGLDAGFVVPASGAGSLVVVSTASIIITLLRRRRTDRRLASRVRERLATLARPADSA